MTELNITLDRKDIARFRRLMKASPKIAAQALTFTAEKAVPAWRAGHAVFNRRNSWIDRGVRVKMATASNLTAQVGTLDKFMGRHVKGLDEPKVAKRGRLFVPAQPAQEQPTHTVLRRLMARMAKTKRKPFRVRDLILRRTGKGPDFKVLGVLRRKVDIEPRLDAEAIAEGVVHREFTTIYERLLLRWAERN